MLLRTFNYFMANSFNIPPKHGIQHLGISNIFKNALNDHNTDWPCVVCGQATDWLSEECGLVSKDNGMVSF